MQQTTYSTQPAADTVTASAASDCQHSNYQYPYRDYQYPVTVQIIAHLSAFGRAPLRGALGNVGRVAHARVRDDRRLVRLLAQQPEAVGCSVSAPFARSVRALTAIISTLRIRVILAILVVLTTRGSAGFP